MEDNEGEEWWQHFRVRWNGAFDDTIMGEAKEEVAIEDESTDDIRDAQRDCKSEKERIKF